VLRPTIQAKVYYCFQLTKSEPARAINRINSIVLNIPVRHSAKEKKYCPGGIIIYNGKEIKFVEEIGAYA
jgi:hypothetical protein